MKPSNSDLATQLAASLIVHERLRQIEGEGYTPEHDDHHDGGEMALAASAYAYAGIRSEQSNRLPPSCWPWGFSDWKPGDRRSNLVKAGALILAELERLAREEAARAERAVSHGKREGAR